MYNRGTFRERLNAEPLLRSLKFHFLTVLRRTLDGTYAAGYSYTIFYPFALVSHPPTSPSIVMTSLPPLDATSSMPQACFPLTSSPPASPSVAAWHCRCTYERWCVRKKKYLLNNDVNCFASMRYFKGSARASLASLPDLLTRCK